MEKLNGRPIVTQFTDYRSYLESIYLWHKAKDRKFSFEFCARKLQTAKSYLRQVFNKEIHVNVNRASDLCQLFKLSNFERQYFVVLLMENQVREKFLKTYFKQILKRMQMNEDIVELKNFRQYKVREDGFQLGSWLSQTIGTMTKFPEFNLDPNWIHAQLTDPVPLAEIKNTITAMIEKGAIKQKDGRYFETQAYHAAEPFETEGHKRHLSAARKIEQVLQTNLVRHRPATFQDGAIALDGEAYKKMTDSCQRFIQEIINISEGCQHPDRIAYLFNSLFLVARPAIEFVED